MFKRILELAAFAALLLAASGTAQAQHFSFSLGHGHGHHHHHGWHFDHCWHDPYFWGPRLDYVYVAPPPRVVYVEPRVAREVRVEAPPVSAAPQWSPPAASAPAPAVSTLQIWNRGHQKIPVAFLVDAREIELFDGQSHSLHGSGKRVVEFDRGGTFGTARYELTSGQYEFVITDRGWDLVRRATPASGISLKPLVKKNVLPGDTVTR